MMTKLRQHLTYANVMSTVAAFLVLAGASAVAANQLAKNSVGPKQLKANAVTSPKIKKDAVGQEEIRDAAVDAAALAAGAVDGSKIAVNAIDGSKVVDGSIGAADINVGSAPFSRIVARLRTSGDMTVTATPQLYPLASNTYTQAAEEINTYVGAVDIVFQESCKAPRGATVSALVDPADPVSPRNEDVVAVGTIADEGSGAVARRIELGSFAGAANARFEPGVPKGRSVFLEVSGTCAPNSSGIRATFGGVDVVGTR